MKGSFSLLTDRAGKIHNVEGEPDALRAMIPDLSSDNSVFDLIPRQQHAFIGDVLRNITRNTEGRISDVSLLAASGEIGLFHLNVKPAGSDRWWFRFDPSDSDASDASEKPTMIWVAVFDSVSYLV